MHVLSLLSILSFATREKLCLYIYLCIAYLQQVNLSARVEDVNAGYDALLVSLSVSLSVCLFVRLCTMHSLLKGVAASIGCLQPLSVSFFFLSFSLLICTGELTYRTLCISLDLLVCLFKQLNYCLFCVLCIFSVV